MDHGDPPPIPTLWKMNVDSMSAFFLEAICMNHKQILPQQLLQVKGPQKSRDPLAFRDRGCLAMVGCITAAWWSGKKTFATGCYFLWQEYRMPFGHKVLTVQINFQNWCSFSMKYLRFTESRPVETGKDGAGGCRRASACSAGDIPRVLPALMTILMSLYIRKVCVRVLAKTVQIWARTTPRRGLVSS